MPNKFECIFINARSIATISFQVKTFLATYKPTLFVVSESWLNSKIPSALFIENLPFSLLRCDRNSRGGGVCIFISDLIPYTAVVSHTNTKYNILCIDIHSIPFPLRVVSVYLTPNIDCASFNSFFEILHDIIVTDLQVCIMGDFNLNLLNPTSSRFCTELLNLFAAADLSSCCNLSTMASGKVIDWVFSSNRLVSNLKIGQNYFGSDHSSIKFNLSAFCPIPPCPIPRANFFKTDFDKLSLLLDNTDWVSVFNTTSSIDDMVQCFVCICIEYFQACVPALAPSSKYARYPNHIMKLIKHRDSLFPKTHLSPVVMQLYVKSCSDISKQCAKFDRNRQLKAFRSSGSKDLFRLIASQRKEKTIYPTSITTPENIVVKGDKNISEAFADYFVSVFNMSNSYLSANFVSLPTVNFLSLDDFVIFPNLVEKCLRKLKPNASFLPDALPQIVLKRCAKSFSVPLSYIYNISLMDGSFPLLWKRQFVVPLPKRDKICTALSSFRPISLTSACSKTFERILKGQLVDFINSNKIIPDNQFGFRSGASVITNLLSSNCDWQKAIDCRNSVDVVFIDIAKAFDTLPFSLLLKKLSLLGISGRLLSLLESFLTGRLFAVKLNDTFSNFRPVLSGVPQGSVLGPILFSLYLSDINTVLPKYHNVHVKLFADDVKLYCIYKYPSAIAQSNMQNTLSALYSYFESLQLKIAFEKCQSLHLGNGNMPSYFLKGELIEEVQVIRDLGLQLSSDFNNLSNISTRYRSALRQLYSMFKCVTVRDPIVLVRCFKTFVLPILEFGSPIWNPHLILQVKLLENVQQLFTRTVYFRCFPSECKDTVPSYKSRIKRLGLLSLECRRVIADLVLAFKIIRGLTTLRLSHFYTFRRSFGRSAKIPFNLHIPKARTSQAQHSFIHRTSKQLMMLQKQYPNILMCDKPHLFKNRLKTIDLKSILQLRF